MIACPVGHYCPEGSYKPRKCAIGALCPPSSVRQIHLTPLYLIIVLDITVLTVILVGYAIRRWRRRRKVARDSMSMGVGAEDPEVVTGRSLGTSCHGNIGPAISAPRSNSVTGRRGISAASLQTSSLQVKPQSAESRTSGSTDCPSLNLLSAQTSEMQKFLRFLSRAIDTEKVGLSFDFEKLSFKVKKGHRRILTNVTGSMARGSMWGIMGGSGAGKSTLVNVLMGKQRASAGTIRINGWAADMAQYKKLIGYVPQDDIVMPELTVRENLLHSARMRLPSSWRDQLVQEFVDSLIECLALSHVKDSLVGDVNKPVISGGQRKRVSIGLELAAAPMAIFLDEPTSGLDATSAASIMHLLKAIASLGVTVISIVHQPREDIWQGFDHLLLLAQGCQVYAGPTVDVVSYFETLGYSFDCFGNPADIIMDIMTGSGQKYENVSSTVNQIGATPVSHLIECWQKKGQNGCAERLNSAGLGCATRTYDHATALGVPSTPEQENTLTRIMKARGASWPAQVYYCCGRSATQQIRNHTSLFFEIGVGGLAGLVIGLSAYSSQGTLFSGIYYPPFTLLTPAVDYSSVPELGLLSAMAIGLAASAPGVWVFGEEKLIYYRESASGHSRSAYYLGKVISTLPRIAVSSLHYTVLLELLATPPMSFGQMYGANCIYFYAIYGGASVVSMIVKREDGPLLAVLASLVIGVLGGVAPPMSKVKTWHMEWFWRLSPGVWLTEAYFSQNLLPSKHLYVLEAASESVGLTLGQYRKDIL